jgi:hypothetical protein
MGLPFASVCTTVKFKQAERAGFEPARAFALRALQARALDQTMRPLHVSKL